MVVRAKVLAGATGNAIDQVARSMANEASDDAAENRGIKKVSSTGTVTYYGDDTATAADKFAAIKTAIEAAAASDTLYLPSWVCAAVNRSIAVTSIADLTIHFGGCKIVELTAGARPTSYLGFTSCPRLLLVGPEIDGGGATTTGANAGVLLLVVSCDDAKIENPQLANAYPSAISACLKAVNCYRIKVTGGKLRNGGYANANFGSCQDASMIGVDSHFTNPPITQDSWQRFVNFEALDGLEGDMGSQTVIGGNWYAMGDFETNWNIDPVGRTPDGTCDYGEISPSTVRHDDYNPGANAQFGKFQAVKRVVMRGMINSITGYDRCVTSFGQGTDDQSVTVEDCIFASGFVSVNNTGGARSKLTIRNSKFLDCRAVGISYQDDISIDCDSNTEFHNVIVDRLTDYWLYAEAPIESYGLINRLDCKVFLNPAVTGARRMIRYAGRFSQNRIGPNFRIYRLAGDTSNIVLAMSLSGGQGNRLCITDLEGVGHFDSLMARWNSSQTTATCGIEETTGAGTQEDYTHAIDSDGSPDYFAHTPGKLGDRIVNDNWSVNGKAKSWIHNGTKWIVEVA